MFDDLIGKDLCVTLLWSWCIIKLADMKSEDDPFPIMDANAQCIRLLADWKIPLFSNGGSGAPVTTILDALVAPLNVEYEIIFT